MEEPAIQGRSATISLTQRGWTGKLVNTTLLPERASISKVGGPGKEFWVFGENFPNSIRRGDPNDYEIGAWRIEVSPPRPAEADLFLNVMEVLDGSAAARRVEKFETADVAAVRMGDWTVAFQKDAGRTDRPVALVLNGAGQLRCLVTDLAGGTWRILRNERAVQGAIAVPDESGVIYFEGPAGNYELRR